MKNIKGNLWFTLVEVLVAITILSLIMTAVIVTFITSSRVNNTVDSSRELQRNIKTAVEAIAEDVRKYGIDEIKKVGWVANDNEWELEGWEILVIDADGVQKQYYIWEKSLSGTWEARDNVSCKDVNRECRLIMHNGTIASPLTNGRVQFEDLNFYADLSDPTSLTKRYKDRVQVNFKIKPSYKQGLPKEFADKAQMTFQTTLSERIINNVTQ